MGRTPRGRPVAATAQVNHDDEEPNQEEDKEDDHRKNPPRKKRKISEQKNEKKNTSSSRPTRRKVAAAGDREQEKSEEGSSSSDSSSSDSSSSDSSSENEEEPPREMSKQTAAFSPKQQSETSPTNKSSQQIGVRHKIAASAKEVDKEGSSYQDSGDDDGKSREEEPLPASTKKPSLKGLDTGGPSKPIECVSRPPLLRLTADMFRQHAALFRQQAAILERVASHPEEPLSWQLEEPSPESIQEKLAQEQTTQLALKGYQSMLQVQKRVNYLEQLMIRNGITKITRSRQNSIFGQHHKNKPPSKKLTQAFQHFLQAHQMRVALQSGHEPDSQETRQEVKRLWHSLNPAQQKPYEELAAQATESVAKWKETTAQSKQKKKSNNDDDSDEESEDESDSDSEDDKPLFQSGVENKNIISDD